MWYELFTDFNLLFTSKRKDNSFYDASASETLRYIHGRTALPAIYWFPSETWKLSLNFNWYVPITASGVFNQKTFLIKIQQSFLGFFNLEQPSAVFFALRFFFTSKTLFLDFNKNILESLLKLSLSCWHKPGPPSSSPSYFVSSSGRLSSLHTFFLLHAHWALALYAGTQSFFIFSFFLNKRICGCPWRDL